MVPYSSTLFISASAPALQEDERAVLADRVRCSGQMPHQRIGRSHHVHRGAAPNLAKLPPDPPAQGPEIGTRALLARTEDAWERVQAPGRTRR